jgi:E3 ubiquitin-protein ligase MARCH6
MPKTLPPLLFARRLAVQLFHWQLFGLRALLVCGVWLAFMPYLTVLVWRFYFWAGESL